MSLLEPADVDAAEDEEPGQADTQPHRQQPSSGLKEGDRVHHLHQPSEEGDRVHHLRHPPTTIHRTFRYQDFSLRCINEIILVLIKEIPLRVILIKWNAVSVYLMEYLCVLNVTAIGASNRIPLGEIIKYPSFY